MSSTREVRELQLSSSQLIILFLSILILGVFIFLLGVSVGKKQSQLAQEAVVSRKATYTPVKRPAPAVPKEGVPSPIEKEIASHANKQAESSIPMAQPGGPTGKPEEKAAARVTASQDQKAAAKTPAVSTPAKPKTEAAKTPPASASAKKKTSATKTAAVPSAKTSAPVKGQYYIQLAAFDERASAEAYAVEIRSAGFPVLILSPLATDRTPWYRVRVGGYATKEDAESAVYRLKAAIPGKKLEYWITRD